MAVVTAVTAWSIGGAAGCSTPQSPAAEAVMMAAEVKRQQPADDSVTTRPDPMTATRTTTNAGPDAPLPDDAAVTAEVVRLHQFFERWFRGSLEKTDESFAPLPAALAADFVMRAPGGQLRTRDETLAGVRGAHGAWTEADAIWIEAVVIVRRDAETLVARYEEWQRKAGSTRGRASVVVFDAGLGWHHLQETWLPADATPRRR